MIGTRAAYASGELPEIGDTIRHTGNKQLSEVMNVKEWTYERIDGESGSIVWVWTRYVGGERVQKNNATRFNLVERADWSQT